MFSIIIGFFISFYSHEQPAKNLMVLNKVVNTNNIFIYGLEHIDHLSHHYPENRRIKNRRKNYERISIVDNILFENNDRRILEFFIS